MPEYILSNDEIKTIPGIVTTPGEIKYYLESTMPRSVPMEGNRIKHFLWRRKTLKVKQNPRRSKTSAAESAQLCRHSDLCPTPPASNRAKRFQKTKNCGQEVENR